MGILSRGARVARPQVRVTSPVLARYLDDLAQQARIADAAADARRLDIHFGRVAPDDPFAGVGQDEIADMVGATGAPRRWLEAADYNKSIGSMVPSAPGEPFADTLGRFDRSRALIQGRLDRLTPEQRPGSLGLVGRQADADARVRRRQAIESDMPLHARAGLAAAGALAGGGAVLKFQQDAAARLQEEEAAAAAEEQYLRDVDEAMAGDPDGAMPMTIDIGEDSPISGFDPMSEMLDAAQMPGVEIDDDTRAFMQRYDAGGASEQDVRQDTLEQFTSQPYVSRPPQGLEQRLNNSRPIWERDFPMPTPEEAVDAAPGPEAPVYRQPDVEDLPGPQLRSIRALMRGGIPEGRARDIILKGSSMSPDEYRMVTGGRR